MKIRDLSSFGSYPPDFLHDFGCFVQIFVKPYLFNKMFNVEIREIVSV